MVHGAFDELSKWFAGLLNPIEEHYLLGITLKHSRMETMLRLSKLAGMVNSVKDQIESYIIVDLNPKPKIVLPDYVQTLKRNRNEREC